MTHGLFRGTGAPAARSPGEGQVQVRTERVHAPSGEQDRATVHPTSSTLRISGTLLTTKAFRPFT